MKMAIELILYVGRFKEDDQMHNTIILKHNEARFTKDEFKRFEKGGLILGFDVYPKELKRWSMDEKREFNDYI